MNMSHDELMEIVRRHGMWLRDDEGGKRANLTGADLTRAKLTRAKLTGADLTRSNLYGADLTGADLTGADLTGANLTGANLYGADLTRANLYGADLYGANLTGAVGGNRRMHCLQIDPYKIIMLDKEIVWGGCTKKTAQEWLEYTGENLSESDRKYLETVTKPIIRMVMGL